MRKSQQRVIFLLFILSICYGITMAADLPCGDWEPYKDEKCFKILDSVVLKTYDDAIKICQQQENSSSLVSIRSLEEQEFFSKLLFKTHKIVDPIWIGAKYSSNKFKWAGDSDVNFTYWAEGSPSNTDDKACVQIIPDGPSIGKWADEPCNKKGLVACQKIQNWSISHLQITLLEARIELQNTLEDVRKQLNNQQSTINSQQSTINSQQSTINNLKENPVPIGFIYFQMPSQPEPKTLWPSVKWNDVTSDYAGLFFRAEGGGSATFGTVQEENSPRLTNTEYVEHVSDQRWSLSIVPGKWSEFIRIGVDSVFAGLKFYVSSGEVRPRNKAMRIWKRTN